MCPTAQMPPPSCKQTRILSPPSFPLAGANLNFVALPNPRPAQTPRAQAWVGDLLPALLQKQLPLDKVFQKKGCALKSFTYQKLCVPKARGGKGGKGAAAAPPSICACCACSGRRRRRAVNKSAGGLRWCIACSWLHPRPWLTCRRLPAMPSAAVLWSGCWRGSGALPEQGTMCCSPPAPRHALPSACLQSGQPGNFRVKVQVKSSCGTLMVKLRVISVAGGLCCGTRLLRCHPP